MSKNQTYTAGASLRINGDVYRPDDKIPAKALKALKAGELEALVKAGKIKTGEDASAEPDPGDDGYTKAQLMAQNKEFTENLLKEAEVDAAEWGELNKEPLVDFYLSLQ